MRRSRTGKWYVAFSCACAEPSPLPQTGQHVGLDVDLDVGLDVGLKTFATLATLSTGAAIANPRFFRHEEQALAKAHRRLSSAETETPERAERRQVVARIDERSMWRAPQ